MISIVSDPSLDLKTLRPHVHFLLSNSIYSYDKALQISLHITLVTECHTYLYIISDLHIFKYL